MSVNGTEELEAGLWIKKQVQAELGDTISGAWSDVIPEGARYPAVRFNVQNRIDVRTVGQHIVMARITFQVIAMVDGNEMKQLPDLANRIFAALHRKNGETNAARILSCVRIQPWGTAEIEQSHVFRGAGGIYELLVQSL